MSTRYYNAPSFGISWFWTEKANNAFWGIYKSPSYKITDHSGVNNQFIDKIIISREQDTKKDIAKLKVTKMNGAFGFD